MDDQGPARYFLGVAVEDYLPVSGQQPLDGARDQMDALADRLGEFGFRTTRIDDPRHESLPGQLAAWRAASVAAGQPAAALVAWSSHARKDDDGQLHLLAIESDPAFSDTSYEPRKLAEHARAVADQALIVLDTCYAGAGTVEVARKTIAAWARQSLPPGRRAWLGVLAAAQPDEEADGQGLLVDQLTRLLTDGPTGAYRAQWAVRTRGITGSDLIQAALREWPDDCGQRLVDVQTGDALPVFHNPRWRPTSRPELVEHLVRAAQGGDRLDEGWFFTGRHAVLTDIVGWLRQPQPGIYTVTGPAGCGKSAVVGRIAALSDPTRRADLFRHAPLDAEDADPGTGSVDAAVHLRGLDVSATITSLAHDLGLAQPATPAELVAEVSRLDVPPVIVLDGLDEAAPAQAGQLRMDLIEPLGRVAKILLATRARAYEARIADGRETTEQGDAALTMVPQSSRVFDLAAESHAEQDIADYARRRLAGGGHPDEQVDLVAAEIARRAVGDAGGFLYARIVTGTLARRMLNPTRQGWATLLGGSITEAFAADLATVDPIEIEGRPVPAAGEDLLRALAWAQGRGLPAGELWQRMATTLGTTGVAYGPDVVDAVLERYGRYIVEDEQDGRAVYRLYHREFVTHLRSVTQTVAGRPTAEVAAEAVLRLLLEQTDDGRRPDQADPYLRRYLSAYAVQAGAQGLAPLRRLAEANPDAWLPDLASSLNNLGNRLAEAGRREEALAPTEEAVTIRRRLAQNNPDAWLPNLAASLNNLGVSLAEAGRREEALAPTEEAVTIRRRLAQNNPDAWLPDLATSLNNLRRITTDPVAARNNFSEVLRDFPDRTDVVHRLRAEWAAGLVDEHPEEAIIHLVDIVQADDVPPPVLVRARELLRRLQHRAPDLVQQAYPDRPAWLLITDQSQQLVVGWLDTATWTESRDYLRLHPELLTDAIKPVLDELALLGNEGFIDLHRTILREATEANIDTAYRRLILDDTLREWMNTSTWEESQAFLTAHPQILDEVDARAILHGLVAGEADATVLAHSAIVTLAQAIGVPEAYRCLTDHQHLDTQVRAALEAQSATLLQACAWLEALLYDLPLSSLAHQAIAAILADQLTDLPEGLSALAAQADVDERNRMAAQIAGLLPGRPDAAPALTALLTAVLSPPG